MTDFIFLMQNGTYMYTLFDKDIFEMCPQYTTHLNNSLVHVQYQIKFIFRKCF